MNRRRFLLDVALGGSVASSRSDQDGPLTQVPTTRDSSDGPPVKWSNVDEQTNRRDYVNDAVPTDDGFVVVGNYEARVDERLNRWVPGAFLRAVDESGSIAWEKIYDDKRASAVLKTPDGYVVAGGHSPGPKTTHGWLMATDTSGAERWSRTYENDASESVESIFRTAEGGFLLGGTRNVDAASGPGTYAKVWRTNRDGTRRWSESYNSYNHVHPIAEVLRGYGDGYVFAGTKNERHESQRAWLTKIRDRRETETRILSGGDVDWSRTFENRERIYVRGAIATSDAGYLLAGETDDDSFRGPQDDTGESALLIKTDHAGRAQWKRTYDGRGRCSATAVAETSDRNFVFALNEKPVGGRPTAYLVSVDRRGNERWSVRFDADVGTRARAIVELGGTYVVAGDAAVPVETATSASGGTAGTKSAFWTAAVGESSLLEDVRTKLDPVVGVAAVAVGVGAYRRLRSS